MDLVRSCYRGQMRFRDADNPVSVDWFFASPGAAVFAGPAVFRGADFEQTPYSNSGLGPQRPPRGTYSKGRRPPFQTGENKEEHWPLSWWVEGIPETETVLIPRAPDGTPLACLPSAAGALVGGAALVSAFPPPLAVGGLLASGEAEVTPYSTSVGGLLAGGAATVSSFP